MAVNSVRALTALGVTAGLLLAPAVAGGRPRPHARHAAARHVTVRHKSVSDICEVVPLPGVPPPFNTVTICVPVPSVG